MMKKILFLLCFSLLLTGCVKQADSVISDEKEEEYQTYYETLSQTNTGFLNESINYKVSTELKQIPDGSYRYVVIIDEPSIAMYNMVVMVVEDGVSYEDCTKMMPSSGIFDTKANLIPSQVNKEDGYAKGVILSGEADHSPLELKLLVQWKNDAGKSYREMLHLTLNTEGNA